MSFDNILHFVAVRLVFQLCVLICLRVLYPLGHADNEISKPNSLCQ